MSESAGKWIEVRRPTDSEQPTLLHAEKPVWIVHYPSRPGRPEFWQAYETVMPVPRGRKPWSIDNRRVGDGNGFPSLAAAMAAAA